MIDPWVWAVAALVIGLVAGGVAGIVVRRVLDRPSRRPAVREIAGPLSMFVFWLSVATGVVVAVAVASPETLEPVPGEVLGWLPTAAVAGLLLIGGYALGLTLAAALGRPLARMAGRRSRTLERFVLVAVLGAASVLALNQLGVDTTIINIVVASIAIATAATLAGVAIVGSRHWTPRLAP